MPNKTDTALRLLIVDDRVEDAEAISSALRNDGIAVRPLRPADGDELAALLASQAVDVVVAAYDAHTIPLQDVARAVASSNKDIPIVGLASQVDADLAAKIYEAGARRVALRNHLPQLLSSIRMEWEDLEARRALRRLGAQVRETERRCDALIESSRDPIAYLHEGMHIRANSAYLDMFGFTDFEDIEGVSLLDLVAAQHVEKFKALLKSIGKGEPPPPRYELEARDSEGNAFPAVMEFVPAQYEGEACLQVVFRRQDSDPELAREVEELRQRDQVTGLLNRQTFLRALEDAVSEVAQDSAQHGLLLVEPDHYQRLLQEIGLDAADAILQAMADRLRAALKDQPGTVAARIGEHSLAVLLRNSDYGATTALAERIRSAYGGVASIGEHSTAVSVSIGGVQIGEKIASVTQVLAKASEGLQSALGVGGNRFEVFDPSAIDRVEEARIQAWVQRLRDALAKGDFVLHYQPVINLRGEPGAIYESLVRLGAEDEEPVPPATFLAVAEEHGLLAPIDRWVVGRAIRTLAKREAGRKPVTLMVKVSQASLGDDSLYKYMKTALKEHGVAGEQLVLLLSEAKVFTHLRAAQEFCAAMSKLGCRCALEHFGMGLDSFQLLSHLKPAFVKLDRSFTMDLPSNSENQQRVNDIAAKLREGDIRSVAEFVQDAPSMAILYSAGVDFVQGNFLASAGPAMNYEFD